MMRTSVLVVALALATPAYADGPPPEATALFEQGIKDMQAGNIEQACKALAASLAKYSDSGTKGALAECYQTLGKVASSWTLWKELVDTAPSDDLKADAAANAVKLESRLPKYTITLAEAVPGLTVTINGNSVADPTLTLPLPVDPGPLVVVASAVGYKSWDGKFAAYEGRTTKIEIPKLAPAPTPPVVKDPAIPNTPQTLVFREDNSAARKSRHVIGGSMLIFGAVAAGVGGYFGKQAFKKYDEVKTVCGGEENIANMCADPMKGQDLTDKARANALLSTILFGAGGVAIVVGGIVWLSAPSDVERKSSTVLRLTPEVGPHGAFVTLSGGWK